MTWARFSIAIQLIVGKSVTCNRIFLRKCARWSTYGYFSGERWNSLTGSLTDEIAMNPAHFASRSTDEVLSTLVHEMVHL